MDLSSGIKDPGAYAVLFSEAEVDRGQGGKGMEQFLGDGKGHIRKLIFSSHHSSWCSSRKHL